MQNHRTRIAVVIVNYRTPRLVISCLEGLARERALVADLSVVVVDNASGDESASFLMEKIAEKAFAGWVSFMPLHINGGFGWGNNEAIQALLTRPDCPDAILLLNPDAEVQAGAVSALVTDLEKRPDAGAIGSQLLNPNGSLAGSAFRFPSIPREFARGLGINRIANLLGIKPTMMPYGDRGPVDWVTGACVLFRVQALREAGLFDTGFFLYFEEVELLHRLRSKGWRCYHCPESLVMHIAGASTGVVDGKASSGETDERVPPKYLFASRHRFFALTGGRFYALCADLAWIAGDLLGRLGGWACPACRKIDNRLERIALYSVGLGAPRAAGVPAITRVGDQSGKPPAWMQWAAQVQTEATDTRAQTT